MIVDKPMIKHSLTAVLAVALTLASAGYARAANPIKLVQSGQVGWEVDAATKGKVCTVASGHECRAGAASSEPGGFKFPEGVTGTTTGNFYVADQGNGRVQELTSAGNFVLMFGKEVDLTTKGDVCTASSGDLCKAAVKGASPGQLYAPQSLSVSSAGEVYVAEYVTRKDGGFAQRVQKFTAGGQFLLEIGKEVNKTTKGNLCTQEEVETSAVECGEPAQTTPEPTEHGVLSFAQGKGNVLADGGGQNLLYVGEEHRIQEFEADGEWKGEISLSATVGAIAIDQAGNLYVVYEGQNIVHELDPEGKEITQFEIHAREEGNRVFVVGIAVDPTGHVAVSAYEEDKEGRKQFGGLYDAAASLELPGFTIPGDAGVEGIAFNGKGELYAAATSQQELLGYVPEPVAELKTGTAMCEEGVEKETSITFKCSLNGEVNPYSVTKTEVWFEWGRTCALGEDTLEEEVATIEALIPVSASIEGLRPNETFCYRLAGVDQNVQLPEQLSGAKASLSTPIARPKIVGAPVASFISSSSAVIYGELNPENARTEYFFEYAPQLQPGEETLAECPGIREAECPGVASTPVGESTLYGKMGTTTEVNGLQPDTAYQYRLAAINPSGESSGSREQEGTFRTAAAPIVEAETGGVSEVTSTSARVSGSVNPDGQAATYTFELGVYRGAETKFGIVFSGPTGTAVEAKSLMLTGLQPGTEYAYQIKISSGYGTATGATERFKTEGLPAALIAPSPLAQLPIPHISFPKAVVTCKHGYTRDKHNKCVKVKKKKKSRKGASRKKK